MPAEIGVQELSDRLRAESKPTVLDVREHDEVEVAPFKGALHIPMGEVPQRIEELDADSEIVVLCHHGIRSLRVAHYLEQAGFQNITNLSGGIDAWSLHIDSSVARY